MRLNRKLAALVAVIAGTGTAGPAAANPYEAFIDIETEEDLHDLIASQQVTEETYETLLDLFLRGVNLNVAGREELYSLPNLTYDDVDAILAYRAEQGYIRDPAELVTAQVITDDKLLAMAAFLVVRDPFAGRLAVHGFVQAQTRFTIGDNDIVPVALRSRVTIGRELTVGVAATMTRRRVGDVVYDPNRDALLADAPSVGFHLPKAYVSYDTESVSVIAGTYRIGFGQRLTFDDSSDYTPNGIYRDDQIFRSDELSRECIQTTGELDSSPCTDDYHYVSPDFKWREALLGVAAGAKHIELGDGWLQVYGWGSFAPRSIYQYELYDRSPACPDPRDDSNEACGAPDVLVRPDGPDRLEPAPALSFQTLPNMYGEALVGGNATYFQSRRNYVGVTAYGARTTWFVDDPDGGADDLALDFQEWSSRPAGGSFGAVGLNTSVGIGSYDIATEVAHSFDAMDDGAGPAKGGGGPAVVVRGTFTEVKKREVELSLRYFSTDFVNPYGRPVAASDEFEGQRARDEVGGRVRYTGRHGKVTVRSGLDLWKRLSNEPLTAARDDIAKGEIYVRADVQASKAIRWGAWIELQDKDLAQGGRDECYEQPFENDELDEPIDCKGLRLSTIGRIRWMVDKKLIVTGQAQHELLDNGDPDDTDPGDKRRHDVSAWLIAAYKHSKDLRLRARVRYLSEDVADSASLEESVWGYADAAVRLRAKDTLRVRADVFQYLDDRDRTGQRTPSPELRLWAQYEAKF